MYRNTLTLLEDGISRGRIIGKDGKKIKDIENVSAAKVAIFGSVVYISADKEDSVKLAERLITKALEHCHASNVKH